MALLGRPTKVTAPVREVHWSHKGQPFSVPSLCSLPQVNSSAYWSPQLVSVPESPWVIMSYETWHKPVRMVECEAVFSESSNYTVRRALKTPCSKKASCFRCGWGWVSAAGELVGHHLERSSQKLVLLGCGFHPERSLSLSRKTRSQEKGHALSSLHNFRDEWLC